MVNIDVYSWRDKTKYSKPFTCLCIGKDCYHGGQININTTPYFCTPLLLLWLATPHRPEAEICVVPGVPKLSPNKGDIDLHLFFGPSQHVSHKHNESLGVLCSKKLSKLSNLLESWVLGPGVDGTLAFC